MNYREPRRYRSFFWPIILIGAGVVFLLHNLGLIPTLSWWSLWRLWPLFLIIAGLDILFARRWPAIGVVMGLVVVGGLVLLLIFGSSLSWLQNEPPFYFNFGGIVEEGELKSDHFEEPLGSAESAKVTLNLTPFETRLYALSDSSKLIEADVDYYNEMRFTVSGTSNKTILLDEIDPSGFRWDFWPNTGRSWDIGLSPRVGLNLVVDMSSGEADLDLQNLNLEGLELEGSSGNFTVTLPDTRYNVMFDGSSGDGSFEVTSGADAKFYLQMSSGRVTVDVEEAIDLDLTVEDGSSGNLNLNLAEGTEARVTVTDHSSGQVRLPGEFARVRQGDHEDEGTWETDGFDSADRRVIITIADMSSGNVIVTYR